MTDSAGAAWRTLSNTAMFLRAKIGRPVVLVSHVPGAPVAASPKNRGTTAMFPLPVRVGFHAAGLTTRPFTTVSTTDLSTPQSVRPMHEREPLGLGEGDVSSLQACLVVDKTDLLARILINRGPARTERFLVATAPRRFGKSFALTPLMQLAAMAKGEKHWFDGYHVRPAGAVLLC